jgi:hypothetical protein
MAVMRKASGLLCFLIVACGPASKKVPMPPAIPVPVAAPATPPSACAELPPGFEPFAALKWGDALYDPVFGFFDKDRDLALTAFFPQVAAENGRVVMATPVEVDGKPDAPEMAAVIVPADGSEPTDFGTDYQFKLGLFKCGEEGYERLGADLDDMSGVGVYALATQLITLPDGTAGTSLRLLHGFQALEMVMYEHLLGNGTQRGTVEVGRQIVVEGGQHARESAIGGSGWFPTGHELRYVSLSYGYNPEWSSTGLAARIIATFDDGGLHTDSVDLEGWAMFGTGAPPAWCHALPARVRCAVIDPSDVRLAAPDGMRFRYDWYTAGWDSAEAARSAVEAAGGAVTAGDWAFLGTVMKPEDGQTIQDLEDAGYRTKPPLGPDGKPPAADLEFTK